MNWLQKLVMGIQAWRESRRDAKEEAQYWNGVAFARDRLNGAEGYRREAIRQRLRQQVETARTFHVYTAFDRGIESVLDNLTIRKA